MKTRFQPRRSFRRGFSLIELMVAVAVFMLMFAMIAALMDSAQRTWSVASSRVSQFKEARVAFESMSRRIRTASLNTYWDYKYNTRDVPTDYIRQSELHFISGNMSDIAEAQESINPTHGMFFQAPIGYSDVQDYRQFQELLNAWGYFVEFGDNRFEMPAFMQADAQLKNRFRLFEFRLPSEELDIYEDAEAKRSSYEPRLDRAWYVKHLRDRGSRRVLAENIIALIFTPMRSPHAEGVNDPTDLTLDYLYDSRKGVGTSGLEAQLTGASVHLLPPLIQITMVAIDEKSASRLFDIGQTKQTLVPGGLFKRPSNLAEDIAALESHLQEIQPRVDYRVFQTTIAMRSARWVNR